MSSTVLIIDDEPSVLRSVVDVLEDEGYETLSAKNGIEGLELFRARRPDVVFCDIWLPDRDGLEVLHELRDLDPTAPVVMISGHGTVGTAVRAIKMGAIDYLEKPIAYTRLVEAVESALEVREAAEAGRPSATDTAVLRRLEVEARVRRPPLLPLVQTGRKHQRTLKSSTVVYGLGLHSGTRTGMVLQPLPADSGIHFLTLPSETLVPAHVDAVADTDHATSLSKDDESIRTVEHLLSALHARGVTNLLIKVHGEVPILDGSALEFCKVVDQAETESQRVARKELVIDRVYKVGEGDESLTIEPYDGFHISYLLRYPPPIGEQFFEFELDSFESFRAQIAPARTFGFMRDVQMMNELGLGSGGRLDNFILVGEDNVINTDLRFPDEFVRHKILDIVGDLYLLGYPVRGKVTARLTGHRHNIAILREILRHNPPIEA
ncbi:MAG: UDP-3-O-acyl-N-acetylglucosamine deacetylase [Acidobacteriota bacterium]